MLSIIQADLQCVNNNKFAHQGFSAEQPKVERRRTEKAHARTRAPRQKMQDFLILIINVLKDQRLEFFSCKT